MVDNYNRIDNNDEIDLLTIIKFFIVNRQTILLCTIACFIIGIFIALFSKKVYLAESALLVLGLRTEVTFEPKIQVKGVTEEIIQRFEEKKKTVSEFIVTPAVLSEVISEAEKNNVVEKGKISFKKLAKSVEVSIKGAMIKIRVRSDSPHKAKFFADKIAEVTVDKLSLLTAEIISKEILIEKLRQARQKYNEATTEYNNFLKNNRIIELSKNIEELKKMYDFYTSNITTIEKSIWQAKNLKEQLESGGVSSVGELADALALLKFKSSIFAGTTELPLKLEFTQSNIQKIDKSNIDAVVKEIDNIISILERRKKEFIQELESKKYEQQIKLLQTELEKEKNREKDLVKNRDLFWDSVVTLERKLQEIEVGKDMTDNIFVKIVYLSELPELPESRNRKMIVIVAVVIGIFLGISVSLIREGYQKVQKLLYER